MPLRTLLSKPGTSVAHRRHSGIIENAPNASESTVPPGCSRADSIQRPGLALSRTNDDPVHPFLTQEPEETQSRRSSLQPHPSSVPPEPKSASTPAAVSTDKTGPHPDGTMDDGLGEAPLPKPQRFSLLGFRHASDPQLSTRFKKEEFSPPEDVARK